MRTDSLLVARSICLLSLGFLLTGCYDTRQEISLNPDGSGKAVMESTFVRVEPLLNARPVAGLENITNVVLESLIEKAEGVDAWRDLVVREQDDGRIFVRATAYFPDLSKFKTDLNSFQRFQLTKDPSGRLNLEPRTDVSQSPVKLPSTNGPVTPESLQRERREYRAAQPWLAAAFGSMKHDTVFQLPGDLRQVSNFETNGPRSLRLRLDGAQLLKVVEAVLFDAEFARRRLAGTAEGFFDTHYANEKLYGQKAPIRAVIVPGGKPLFDYASEVAEARQAFPALARTLGVNNDPEPPARPVVDGAPARTTVTAVQWRFDRARFGPFNDGPRQGYTLSVNAELPGTVLETRKIELTRALTVEGVRLETSSTTFHRVGSGWDATSPKGRTNVNFDIELKSPPLDSKGLAEITGIVECDSAENLQTVDLISGRLRPGAKGEEFVAELESVSAHIQGGEKLVLRARFGPKELLSLRVIGESGQVVPLEKRGWMAIGDEHSYTCIAARPLPRTGRLVADVLTGSQTVRIPFSLTNLSLLGQPLALVDGK